MTSTTLDRPTPISICQILTERINSGDYRKGEKARMRLMRAAAELLDEVSLHDIRNVDICQRAQLANGMLNTYFDDKFDLVAQLLSQFAEEFQREFADHTRHAAAEKDGYVRIYIKIDYIVATCEANLGVYRLLMDPPQHAELRAHISKAFRFWVDDLALDLPANRFGVALTDKQKFTLSAMLSGMVDEAVRRVYFTGTRPMKSRQEMVEMLSLLRFSAMFGKDPQLTSIEQARAL